MRVTAQAPPIEKLRAMFGEALKEREPLARYTSARIGGPAEVLVEIKSADELAEAVSRLWELSAAFVILGGGSNVLISDAGVRGVVLLNRAKTVRFEQETMPPRVWAESGASFGAMARQASKKGLSGLEWASGLPGTVGGAVVGNAGAHGGDVAGSLELAEILHRKKGRESWSVEDLALSYRSSKLKQRPGEAVVLSAKFALTPASAETIQKKMDAYLKYRRKTQPPGASMGSMFKNPPEDYAGRLIEAAGLKGLRIGDAQISPKHANFFLNRGKASSDEVLALLERARSEVAEQFGIELELEIELLGEWKGK